MSLSVNTNIAASKVAYHLNMNRTLMTEATERIASGKRINSARDDAAGSAIAGRMTAQMKGLEMAVRNAHDGINMAQTAEGVLNNVRDMLQRIRELAIQAASSVNSSADREALDDEVQQLKSEIDRIATTTQFNGRTLHDGTMKGEIQLSAQKGGALEFSIRSLKTDALGMGEASFGGDVIVSSRLGVPSGQAIQRGDIKINSQDIAAIPGNADAQDMVTAINNSVDNVRASAFNVVVAKNVGDGITADDAATAADAELVITVTPLTSGTTKGQDTVFTVPSTGSLDELVDKINQQAGNAVMASINGDGKLTMTNRTGATISVSGNVTAAGFESAQTFRGFLKLESTDGSPIRVEKGNHALAVPGSDDDLEALGFRTITQDTKKDAYTVVGKALTAEGAAASFADEGLRLNGVEIYDESIDTTSIAGKLNAINAFAGQSGVVAGARVDASIDMSASTFGGTSAEEVTVQGTLYALKDYASVSKLAEELSKLSGITATANGQMIRVEGSIEQLTVLEKDNSGSKIRLNGNLVANTGSSNPTPTTGYAAIKLDSTNNTPISIELGSIAPQNKGATAEVATFTFGATTDFTNMTSGDTLTFDGLTFTSDGSDTIDTFIEAFNAGVGHTKITGSTIEGFTLAKSGSLDIVATQKNGSALTDMTAAAFVKTGAGGIPASVAITTQGTNATGDYHGFLEQNVGASDFDTNKPQLGSTSGSSMTGLSITSVKDAFNALGTIDTALATVSKQQAELGAIQNRLTFTASALNQTIMSTTQSRASIIDADFAAESSKLAKEFSSFKSQY